MAIAVLNTDAGLSGKTIQNLEDAQTVTGLKTFDRDPNPPFAVSASSAVVPNLDADSVDGAHYIIGTWTPTIGGSGGQSGQVYVNQEGRYIKIGTLVWAAAYVSLSTLGTITGNVQIQGLPFTAENGVLQFYPGSVIWDDMTTALVSMGCHVLQNTTTIKLLGRGAADVSLLDGALAQADLSNTSKFNLMVVYKAAS